MDLRLINGTSIIDADRKLLRFLGSEYELYDGIPVPRDNALSLFDILLSIMMNSRLDTAGKVQSIWNGKSPVDKALSAISADAALEDEVIPWDDLRVLFDAFCGIRWAGAAVTTKILYKKRPKLIPICDYVISRYLGQHNDNPRPWGASPGQNLVRDIRDMKYFRELLLGSFDQIEALRRMPEMQSFPVSPMRVLEVLLWVENEDNGYCMICPQCRAEKVIPIKYGEPSPKLVQDAENGKAWIGGCCATEDSPKWHCPTCGAEFGTARS